MHCEVECCMLECQMAFVDHRGNDIAAQIPKRDPNSSGCYTLRNSVTVQDHTDRFMITFNINVHPQTVALQENISCLHLVFSVLRCT